MTTTTVCACGSELAEGLLACPVCKRLVHSQELTLLAQRAKESEERGDLTAALTAWRRAIELLPPGTDQGKAIDATMRRLSAALVKPGATARTKAGASGGKKAGAAAGVGAVGAFLLKSKAVLALLLGNGKLLLLGLLKAPTLISMALYAAMLGGQGWGLSIGIVAAIYVHEIGHVATLRRFGIDASAPMFVPGFGALVRLKQYPTDAHEEARTGLAGPFWGLFASVVALAIGAAFSSPTALQVASWSASINVFNLIAVWQLDGARGLKALSQRERMILGVIAIAVGLLLHQWMPAIVGVVALGRALAAGSPVEGDRPMLWLFLALVTLHPAVASIADTMRAVPG